MNNKYNNKKVCRSKERISNKSKTVGFVVVLIFSFCVLSNFSFGKNELKTREFIVSSNDTIWNISKEICNNSDKSLNIQNVVRKIIKINNLNDSNIYVGQVIKVPIY